MRYLSVCSGIEAATVAWQGWEPVGFSEIEKFPSQVLAHHYPSVPNLGDMTNYQEWDIGTIDLLVGGTPCQSFSVAGLRKGLEDPRGNLALVYCGILDRFKPKWFVWENVPGVLSSSGGRDFGSFLGAVAELGYGFAYRVLDAQYFGVAQRRRRVFVVGYLGDWRPAAEVLFERESLSGNPAPSRETGQAAPTSFVPSVASYLETTCHDYSRADGFNMIAAPIALAENMIGRQPHNGGNGDGFTVAGPMYTLNATGVHGVAQPVAFAQNSRDEVRLMNGDGQIVGALAAEPGMKQTCYVAQPIAYSFDSLASNSMKSSNPHSGCRQVEVSKTLDTTTPEPSKNQGGIAVVQPVHAIDYEYNAHTTDKPTGPLLKGSPTGGGHPLPAVMQDMAVRRLTPIECERLQGFSDTYTAIPWRKKEATECPDGPRYKALGNSMAVPVMHWIGKRIEEVSNKWNKD